ncbi:MAG: putative bifunctional diguanylate cyclase/phosphodiesterase [Rhodanobacteraceae bacterium]
MGDSRRPVLVVASSREDRRVLFDALDGLRAGEILSARDAAHARALLGRSARPTLAILDFAHVPTQARDLCGELEGVPVIGLFGAGLDLRDRDPCPSTCGNIKAWLRVPVDATEAAVRVRELLDAPAPAAPSLVHSNEPTAPPQPPQIEPDATLQMLAALLQPARDAAGLPTLVQRALQALGMDLMVIAERSASGDTLHPLARMDRLSAPGAPDPLTQAFVRQALEGEAVVRVAALAPDNAAMGYAWHAALPLFDTARNTLGVMVCASRVEFAGPPETLKPVLEIVASRFAALLELRAERERSRSSALMDGLTGLPNRILFNDRLKSVLHDARRTGEVFAVLFVDMDRFKGINDSLGHAVGDQVLVAGAQRLTDAVRASDTVARYAGDEFTVIIRHVNGRGDIDRVTAKLLKGMQAPLVLDDGSELHVTTSIGISIYPEDATDAEGLIKHADMAMYSAKARGRNNMQTYADVPMDMHGQRAEMESRLRQAEANGELSVHYQPQVDIASEDILGVEASVRWQHPVLGLLSPAFFMPLAEETGQVLSIGEWVLRRACADVAAWRRRNRLPLRLAVNLSALQWMQPNLAAMVEAACREAKLDPDVLDLETPEGVLANPQAELVTAIGILRKAGCRVVADHAGVAHSAPELAGALPVDAIKIDASFVRNVGSDPDDESVVTSILDAARAQGRRVIAEGVETERQLEFLRERGCDAAQGPLFSRALPAAALTRLLVGRRAALAARPAVDVQPTPDHPRSPSASRRRTIG